MDLFYLGKIERCKKINISLEILGRIINSLGGNYDEFCILKVQMIH